MVLTKTFEYRKKNANKKSLSEVLSAAIKNDQKAKKLRAEYADW